MTKEAPIGSVFELKPMRLGDLLDVVIRLYRRYFGQFVRIGAVVFIPLGIVQVVASALSAAVINPPSQNPISLSLSTVMGFGLIMFYWVAFWLTWPLVQGAVAKAVAEFYLGRDAPLGETYRFALRRWQRLIAVALLTGGISLAVVLAAVVPAGAIAAAMGAFEETARTPSLIIAIGLAVLLFLAGLAAALAIGIRLLFSSLVIVLENRRPIAAITRSWELTAGRFWQLMIAVLVLSLFAWIGSIFIMIPTGLIAGALGAISAPAGQALAGAAQAVAQIIVAPLQIIGIVLLYYDLRMRKEGFDLAMMAEAIHQPVLATRAPTGEAVPALFGPHTPSSDNAEEIDEPTNED